MSSHQQYMRMALAEAEKALALGEFPVGCILVSAGGETATGGRQNSLENNEIDHAEIVALRKLFRKTGAEHGGFTVYSTMEPCLMCFSTLLLNGVTKVVYGYEDVMGGATDLDVKKLRPLYSSSQPEIIPYVLRDECLTLFQRFFNDPGSHYLRGTLLAEYTIRQKLP